MYNVLWIHLSTDQNNIKKQNMKYKLSKFSLYRSIVFWEFFFVNFSTVLWHCITVCHGISRNTGFYLRKGIHDICCMQKRLSFYTQFALVRIFELHKDWPVIIPVKVLVVRYISSIYPFCVWDAYFHIRITGVIVTSGIDNKHRLNFGEKLEVTAFLY